MSDNTLRNTLPLDHALAFCRRYHMKMPVLLAPMAGACPVSLSTAVANAGGMGAMGAVLTPPSGIRQWVEEFRSGSAGPLQLNVWIPDPEAQRDTDRELRMRTFLAQWGPPVPAAAGDIRPPNFDAQCDMCVDLAPTAVSSIMGVFPERFVVRLKDRGVAWFATATTLAEARFARSAGAEAVARAAAPASDESAVAQPSTRSG